MPLDDLIGSAEACEILALRDDKPLDRSTLSRWVKDGKLTPAMRLNGKTGAMLFHRAEVLALAERPEAQAS